MLWYLLDGRAYTSTELAIVADISAQSASNHLAKLVEAAILKVEKQGRHRYYIFASGEAAYAIESLNTLTGLGNGQNVKSPAKENELTKARTCYDHLAGKLGVRLTENLMEKGIITNTGNTFVITQKGEKWFNDMGIGLDILRKQKRKLAYPCLDWSERKHHLAGALGSALLQVFLDKNWIKRKGNSRAIILTPTGEIEINKIFRSL